MTKRRTPDSTQTARGDEKRWKEEGRKNIVVEKSLEDSLGSILNLKENPFSVEAVQQTLMLGGEICKIDITINDAALTKEQRTQVGEFLSALSEANGVTQAETGWETPTRSVSVVVDDIKSFLKNLSDMLEKNRPIDRMDIK